MPAYANGTVYGKYIKIKSGAVGVKKCSDYINDPEKIQPLPKGNQPETKETYQAENAIHYIQNDPKIINPSTGKRLVSGHNCCADTAFQEFSLIEKLYHAHKTEKLAPGQTPNQAFHIILSYKGTDSNPEIIHEMGCEFARRLCGDEFQALIATHLNTNNYHNHILVNAYALDGRHKFKDNYHVYQKFRQIANEISLEYGLPVFVNNKKERPYKSWKEFIATEEGESWKQTITHDLDESISAADSYEEVLKQMEQKGYEIQHNPKSITFKKDDGMVRDRRLGYPYTYEGICNTMEKKKQKNEFQNRKDELNKQQESRTKNILYPGIYVPRYDQYGRRRNFLTRFLLMLKKNISTAIDTPHKLPTQTSMPKSFILKKAEKQIKLLEEWIKIADQYGITNIDALEIQLRELHAKNAPYLRTIFNLEDYLENAGKIKQLIEKYRKLEPVLTAQTIHTKDIIFIPDSAIIQENRARLNPMQPKTCSDLFQALYNSPYRLMRKFKTLTETEAQQIIKSIRKEQKENLPDGLHYGRKRWNKQEKNCNYSSKNTEDSFTKRKPIDLKKYDQETRQAILDFKKAADTLASYGLTDETEMDNFLHNIAEKVTKLDLQKSFSKEIHAEIKRLFQLKKVFSQFPSTVLIHQKLMADENKNSTRYDMLFYMKSRLEKLPNIKEHGFQTTKQLNPDEYRFIYDLQSIYPDRLNIHSMAPEDIHYLIVKLKAEGFFEKEMERHWKMKKRRKETKMSKTTLKDIKNLIHESKNTHEQTNSANLIIESPNTERPLLNENYESHNPFTFFTNTKEKALEPQESETQNTTIPQHSSSTNTSPNFNNNTDNKICIRKKDLYHPVKKRKSSITQEKEILLKKFEGEFTIKELSDKLNLPASSLYYWAKKNHYQTKNRNSHTSISNALGKKILTQLNTMSIAELAKEYHLPYHVLYYWIKKQGLCTKKSSVFSKHIQRELREKCRIFSLKELAQDYELSVQTMRSRLKNIGCFSDGQDGFLIVDEVTAEEIKSFYGENGINKTAEKFHTTKIAIKSFLKKQIS